MAEERSDFLIAVRTLAKTILYNYLMLAACMLGAALQDPEILWPRLHLEMRPTCSTFKLERVKQSAKEVVKTVMLPKSKAL